MLIFHDARCADYGSSMRPEQPSRVTHAVAHLQAAHPAWEIRPPPAAGSILEATLLRAHAPAHLRRLAQPRDFDADTPFFPGIADHARHAVAAALAATEHALTHRAPAFALMRPPGHHATADTAMGFCYLNHIAIAALHAHHQLGARRVAIWDFDAHHGNGTEAILQAPVHAATRAFFFSSVHQSPCYPGTGLADVSPLLRNWPIPPHAPRAQHLAALRASFDAVIAFAPDLILVSAGFDAYVGDPITAMTLEREDFATLGTWLREARLPAARVLQNPNPDLCSDHPIPVAAILEGGYSADLPLLIDAFLSAWAASPST